MLDKNEITISKSAEGVRIDGILDGKTIISINNFNLQCQFQVSQCSTFTGKMDHAEKMLNIISRAMVQAEMLKESYEGKVSIGVVKGDKGEWLIMLNGFNESSEKDRDEAITLARHFKEKYEKAGVTVSYTEED